MDDRTTHNLRAMNIGGSEIHHSFMDKADEEKTKLNQLIKESYLNSSINNDTSEKNAIVPVTETSTVNQEVKNNFYTSQEYMMSDQEKKYYWGLQWKDSQEYYTIVGFCRKENNNPKYWKQISNKTQDMLKEIDNSPRMSREKLSIALYSTFFVWIFLNIGFVFFEWFAAVYALNIFLLFLLFLFGREPVDDMRYALLSQARLSLPRSMSLKDRELIINDLNRLQKENDKEGYFLIISRILQFNKEKELKEKEEEHKNLLKQQAEYSKMRENIPFLQGINDLKDNEEKKEIEFKSSRHNHDTQNYFELISLLHDSSKIYSIDEHVLTRLRKITDSFIQLRPAMGEDKIAEFSLVFDQLKDVATSYNRVARYGNISSRAVESYNTFLNDAYHTLSTMMNDYYEGLSEDLQEKARSGSAYFAAKNDQYNQDLL